jgi:protein ImuA
MVSLKRADIIAGLQSEIIRMQGLKPSGNLAIDAGLGPIKDAFPNATFPVGAVHEFLTERTEDGAACSGFVAGLTASLMRDSGTLLWVSPSRKVFPPALKFFGIQPDRCIFIDLQKEKDVLWTMNEALRCTALTAVVAEIREMSFTASRRLQLAVEQSLVTGFILRNSGKPNTSACISRWKITPLPSAVAGIGIPGIGFPTWRVELLRIRNGRPGVWDIQWRNGRFQHLYKSPPISNEEASTFDIEGVNKRKAG